MGPTPPLNPILVALLTQHLQQQRAPMMPPRQAPQLPQQWPIVDHWPVVQSQQVAPPRQGPIAPQWAEGDLGPNAHAGWNMPVNPAVLAWATQFLSQQRPFLHNLY